MNNKIKIILLIGLLTYVVQCHAGLPAIKHTIEVVDQDGKVIPDADFAYSFHPGKSINELEHLKTNSKGLIVLKGVKTPITPGAGGKITKEGYYPTYAYSGKLTINRVLNRWEPWDKTTTTVLKKIKNPVSMYAQRTGLRFPKTNTTVGYDLEKGDLVAPHGKGLISDFIFTCKNEYVDRSKYHQSISISFSNPNDGIQLYQKDENDRSEFIWPYKAPVKGYINSIYKFRERNWNNNTEALTHNIIDEKGSYELDIREYRIEKPCNYIFRIRTKVDKDGSIISAKYGKIQGDFQISGVAVGGGASFIYYFNPDGTRNLEFDKKNNLFKWPQTNRKERVNVNDKTALLKP